MRNLLFILCVLFLVSGCGDGRFNFNLSGKIDGLGNDTVYICRQEGGLDAGLDTIVAKGGSFEYNLKIDTVNTLILIINDHLFPVYADRNTDVTVKGAVSALNSLQIKGGELNDELNEFRMAAGTLQNSGTDLIAKAENYIRVHTNSLTSIYVLDRYFVQVESPDYPKIAGLIKLLDVDLQDDAYVKQLSELADLQISVEPGKAAPFFNNKDKNGKSVILSDFKDKYILMTFWASWLTSYSKDQKAFRKLADKYKKRNLALLGVSLDLDRERWLDAIKKDTLGGVQVTDLKGWENSIVKQYGIEKLPSNILIGPDKKIVARNLTEKDLTDKLEEIFNK